ncbi:MAG: LysR substrate-binding domain-containing protein [Kiloniellales bacterium]|nr:LysR substrate-binding domain-containing protein [Kiloniellales bacterium]
MVTLRQIEAFRAVMITGTVTQAAAMLFVSQPAVSRILADLERVVGFKLFTRANRQLIPTDEARALYDEVERAFIGLQQIDQAATSIRQYRGGHFRLITIPSLASTIMSELIGRFVERYPEIVVSLEVRPSQRVIEWIVSQQCDMGLSSTPTDNANVTTRPIASADAVCVLPDGHPLTAKKRLRPKDMAGLPFISFKSDAPFRHRVDEIFSRAGVTRDLRLEARTIEAICGLVAVGLGISIVGPVVSADALPKGVTFRPFEPEVQQELALVYSANKPLSRLSLQFIEVVEAYMAQVSPRLAMGQGVGITPIGEDA